MIQTKQDTQGNAPTQYILLKSNHINKTISHKSYGLYSNEEEAYAAALVRQMQSIEESSKNWPRNVIDEHWQNIHTLCKYMKENLTSFKERFEHFHTMTLFAEHCPVSYQVIPLLSAADNLLNESLFKTKTRNFMDAFQSTKTDEEVDLANSEDDDDEDDDELSGEDGSDDDSSSSNGEEDIEETEGEEEEEEEEDGDDEEEEEEEEQNENTQLDEEENENSLLEGDGSENPPTEENENSLLEEDENENPPVEDEGEEQVENLVPETEEEDQINEEQVENPVPETEEEDQINEEQTDEEGFEDEEQINRGIKRSRSVVEEDEEDEIDEDELAEDEDEPITRKRKIEE